MYDSKPLEDCLNLPPKGTYYSGGLDPNWQPTCGTCDVLRYDYRTTSHGWCPHHQMASVSVTGGCREHTSLKVYRQEAQG